MYKDRDRDMPFLVERAAVERVRGGLLSTVEAELSVPVTVRCRGRGGSSSSSSSGALCVTEGGPLSGELLSLLAGVGAGVGAGGGAGVGAVRFSSVSGAWLEPIWGPPPAVAVARVTGVTRVAGVAVAGGAVHGAGAGAQEGLGDTLYMQSKYTAEC
jgi:hypothetical protein